MRLRIDDFTGMPFLRTTDHKLKSYYTKSGLERRSKELSELIEKDLTNIDYFVQRWHEMHQPLVTNWEGHQDDKTTEASFTTS